jgi:nucleotide-binding universal stress UspA family protein
MHGPPSGFARLILSPVTERVVAKAACPVLAVPRRLPTEAAEFAVHTIVCGVDRPASSRQTLEHACVVAQLLDALLIVVHVIEDLEDEDPVVVTGHSNTPEGRREVAPQVQASYEPLMPAGMRLNHKIEIQTPVGAAHTELLRVASQASAELIVLGATGWRGSFGKTVRHVLRDAGCDVMAVPSAR